jgi:hypothetical protein
MYLAGRYREVSEGAGFLTGRDKTLEEPEAIFFPLRCTALKSKSQLLEGKNPNSMDALKQQSFISYIESISGGNKLLTKEMMRFNFAIDYHPDECI